mmetsp:Transcript_29082/g.62554  ORF Transcript_29082/g.62554 Transcript_29082/m.62554 type:complete len:221 (-) Transcript_29082:25-687(-)
MRTAQSTITMARIGLRGRNCISCLLALAQGLGQPVKTFVQTITGGRTGGLNVPLAVTELVEAQALGDLVHAHGVGKILLVGEDQEDGITQLILSEHAVQLVLGAVLSTRSIVDTLPVVGIDNEDDALGVLVVVAPQGTDLVLTSDIPHGKANVLVLDSFHVETDGGDGGDDLTQLQLVEDGGLSGGIQTDHQDPHLLLAEHALPEARESETHGGDGVRAV